jgi:hypothetical protein
MAPRKKPKPLNSLKVATPERFELPTYGIEIHCSIQLSYGAGAAGESPGAG